MSLTYENISAAECDHVVGLGDWRWDGIENSVQPGDVIGIASGSREGLLIENVNGADGSPVIITNCDGRATLGTDKDYGKGIEVKESSFFQIAGTGSSSHKYGVAVIGYMAMEITRRSTDFEVFGVEVPMAGYGGIVARSDATCDGYISKDNFTQRNTNIHHNYVHDTGGEGFYIGGSHWGYGQTEQSGCRGTTLWEPELKGVRVHHNKVLNTGYDGLQVGAAIEDCEIYNNDIENYGLANVQGHMAGLQINPGTTGPLYNNIIKGGTGYGIFMTGAGGNIIYNNLIINAALDGIMDGDRTPLPGQGFSYLNNTIINPGGSGIYSWAQEQNTHVFYNNLVTIPGSGRYADGVLSNIVIADNIQSEDIDSLLLDGNYLPTVVSSLIDAGRDVSAYGVLSLNVGYYEQGGADVEAEGQDKTLVCESVSFTITGKDVNLEIIEDMAQYYKSGVISTRTNRGETSIDSPTFEVKKVAYTVDDSIVYVDVYHEVQQGIITQNYTGTVQVASADVLVNNKIDMGLVETEVLALALYSDAIKV